MTKQEDYLGSLDADELQEEQEFLDNHWVNDMLDAPHALIAVIETKLSRALLGERRRIVQVLTENCSDYHTALIGCECSVQIELIS
jgi:hypothetical protein